MRLISWTLRSGSKQFECIIIILWGMKPNGFDLTNRFSGPNYVNFQSNEKADLFDMTAFMVS